MTNLLKMIEGAEMTIPADAVPESGIVIVTYLQSDGKRANNFKMFGDKNSSDIAGTFALVQHEIFHRTQRNWGSNEGWEEE